MITATKKSNSKFLIVVGGIINIIFAVMNPFALWVFAVGLVMAGIQASIANPDPMMILVMFALGCSVWAVYRVDGTPNPIPATARTGLFLFNGFSTFVLFMSQIMTIVENPSQDLMWVQSFWSSWVLVMWILYALAWHLAKSVEGGFTVMGEMFDDLFPPSDKVVIRGVLDELNYHHLRWGLKAGCNPRRLEDGAFHIRNNAYAKFPDDIGGLVEALRAKFEGRNVGVSKSDAGITIRVWADDER